MMMPIDGSVHEAATIPEVELRYFPPDFEEYIRTEQLNCSLFEGNYSHDFEGGWVFWSQRDPQTQPDNYADLIRHALQKLASKEELYCKLVQFWAPTKTSEGRTLLTTQFQPFALCPPYTRKDINQLCEYRMGMCREYNNSFYADAECPQEQLGVPGRVFLHQFPEFAVFVTTHYTLEEYPQRDLALRCGIESSRAVPVFDQSTHACVGVLEIVSPFLAIILLLEKSFLGRMYDIFQEFGLLYIDGYKHYEMQIRDENTACTVAFQELKPVLEMVCNIHKLPLAMIWVPCSTCNDSLQGQLILKGVEFCRHGNISMDKASRKKKSSMDMFIEASKCGHLRTGVVARMVRSSSNILYCSDITQLSLVDYPLVPHARECKFRGWFTIRLQSSYTANNIYVLELFLPYGCNSEKSLSLILGMMVENFRTFKLASGQELGDLLRVEVMKFRKGQKLHSFKNIQATRLSRDADMVGTSLPLPGEDQEQEPSLNSLESTARFCNMVTIKAKLPNYYTIKFSLSSSARFVELQQQVAKRLNHLEAGTYRVFYEDEENERTLIDCDEDLQGFLHTARSLGYTSVVVLLEPN